MGRIARISYAFFFQFLRLHSPASTSAQFFIPSIHVACPSSCFLPGIHPYYASIIPAFALYKITLAYYLFVLQLQVSYICCYRAFSTSYGIVVVRLTRYVSPNPNPMTRTCPSSLRTITYNRGIRCPFVQANVEFDEKMMQTPRATCRHRSP